MLGVSPLLLLVLLQAGAADDDTGTAAAAPAADTTALAPHRPWLNASLPIPERVRLLLAVMSTAEKVNQLQQTWSSVTTADLLNASDCDPRYRGVFGANGVGAVYIANVRDASNISCTHDVQCRVEARNELQREMMALSRHGIPIAFVVEALHSVLAKEDERLGRSRPEPPLAAAPGSCGSFPTPGQCAAHGCTWLQSCSPQPCAQCVENMGDRPMGTVFPMPVNQGATWNRSAAAAIATAIALESRAAGCDRAFGPELQVATDVSRSCLCFALCF